MPGASRSRKCPLCDGPVDLVSGPHRPFCSERCKLIDLGAWATGRYAIPGAPLGSAADPLETSVETSVETPVENNESATGEDEEDPPG